MPSATVRGDVYLKGYGDPSLSTPTFQRERLGVTTSSITGFVAHLKALGVTRIAGHVVGDGSWFDDKKRVAVWNPGIEEDCGPLGALSVNEGLRDGERVKNPPRYAARRLTEALEDAGIAVSGDPRAGRVPGDAWLTATLVSARLRALLKPLLKRSDNFFAEMLVKGLGRDFAGEGSTLAGLRVVRRTLTNLGSGHGGAEGHGRLGSQLPEPLHHSRHRAAAARHGGARGLPGLLRRAGDRRQGRHAGEADARHRRHRATSTARRATCAWPARSRAT